MKAFGRLLAPALAIMFLVLPLSSAQTPSAAIPQSGPDVPTATPPVAVLHVFENEVYSYDAGARARTISVPAAPWNRVVLVLESHPEGDPWDRTFGVAIGDVEVIHGTTPRTAFTIEKDVTEFGSLLPAGGSAVVKLLADSWVAALVYNVDLEFYDDPTGLAITPKDSAHPAFLWQGMCMNGQRRATTVEFPEDAPASAILELTASGHGVEEAHFLSNPHHVQYFHVLVDGVEVARIVPFPYVYAIQGFYGETGILLHPLMWWTAQRVLDAAGVHGGVGEIPPYRVIVDPAHLDLLSGARDVELVTDGGTPTSCVWITSVSFLLDA